MRAHDGRGRHTTVTRELMMLPSGALSSTRRGSARPACGTATGGAFADIEELAARCRFTDCGHTNEPDCAVRAEGSPERVEAWRKLERSRRGSKTAAAAARERKQFGKKHARTASEVRRWKGDLG